MSRAGCHHIDRMSLPETSANARLRRRARERIGGAVRMLACMDMVCCGLVPFFLVVFVIAMMVRGGFDAWDARARWGTVLTAV